MAKKGISSTETISKVEEKKRQLGNIKEQEQELIIAWKKDASKDAIIQMPCYFEMQHYINMVVKGKAYGVVISSRGGTGKTFTTIAELTRQNIDFAYLDTFTTPQRFYTWLYQNRNRIKVLDDVYGLLENNKCNAMLKACLWEAGRHRIVSYETSKPLEDEDGCFVPNHFEETGRIIILTNHINEKSPHVNAILTRVNHVQIEITNEEMLDIMKEIMKKPYHNLNINQRKEVLEFLYGYANESVMDFNLRTLIKGYNFYEYAEEIGQKDIWKRLMAKMLKRDDKLVLVEEIEKTFGMLSIDDKVAKFVELNDGRGSRATYMRLKNQLGLTKKGSNLTEKPIEIKA